MAHPKKRKRPHKKTYSAILFGILIAVALICIAIIATPAVASFGVIRIPDTVPLLRAIPLQSQP